MAQLIRLTRANTSHSHTEISNEITVNIFQILMIEDYHGSDDGESRVTLQNGKNLIVTESQEDIRALAEKGAGGGLF